MKIKELYNCINRLAPFDSQCEWDNSGLLIGSPDTEISRIGFALDAVPEVIEDAVQKGCNLIITHHPVIFNPLESIDDKSPAYLAIKSCISILSVHTPFDKSCPGVNTVLAGKLGISEIKQITDDGDTAILKMGELPESVNEKNFADIIAKALGGAVIYSACGKSIRKVAVCGGAGGDFFAAAKAAGADALVTGEAKHHEFIGAKSAGITLYAAGHFETEAPAMEALKDYVMKETKADCVMLSQPKTTQFTGAI